MVTRLTLAALLTSSCTGVVLRDRDTYVTEVAFTDRMMREGAGAVRSILFDQCACRGEVWVAQSPHVTNRLCQTYADWWTVYAIRWPWHRGMMLYNGRLLDTRPPSTPALPRRSCEIPDVRSE